MLEGLLPEGMMFPFDFGFIPSTLGDDGEPLDIMVLMDAPAHVGCLIDVRIVGVIDAEQTQNGKTEKNSRLLGAAKVVNLLSVSTAEGPEYFASLVAEIQELRLGTGRPHWLIIDEAHHVLPSNWAPSSPEFARQLSGTILITVHPGHVSPAALSGVNIAVVLGTEPQVMLDEFAKAIEREPPKVPPHDSSGGEAWVWFCEENHLIRVRPEPSRSEQH
jgi:hypothetical protein